MAMGFSFKNFELIRLRPASGDSFELKMKKIEFPALESKYGERSENRV